MDYPSKNMIEKPCIVILTGSGAPARAAGNIYHELLSEKYRLVFIEERTFTIGKVVRLLKRRWRASGIFSIIDFLLLRIVMQFESDDGPNPAYSPTFHVGEINSKGMADIINSYAPVWIFTNACSILSQELLSLINSPILNVHNGITPRYRGAGNFWAIREDNPSLIGVTVHRVDKGIDTGERLAVSLIDPIDDRFNNLRQLDVLAFESGARLICEYIQNRCSCIPRILIELRSHFYSYPGLSDWLIAQKTLKRWRKKKFDIENDWKISFDELKSNSACDQYQRMHWERSESVTKRDNLILCLAKKFFKPEVKILDIGGGDGRLGTHMPSGGTYVCVDYTYEFLIDMNRDPSRSNFAVQCDARSLPFPAKTFDLIISVGLFQHLAETQRVADNIQNLKKDGAPVIINTLRQFSLIELLLIIIGSVFYPNRMLLAYCILKRDYFSGRKIGGVLVARRYSRMELLKIFHKNGSKVHFYYDGLFGSRIFSREITVVLA